MSEIEVTQQPAKTVYKIGEQLNITGLEVTATYSNGTTGTVAITAADITGFSSAVEGEKTLTVTYRGKTATFTITVTIPIEIIVTNTDEWNAAKSTVQNGGNYQDYIITVSGDVPVPGGFINFGTATDVTITLRGNGKLYLTSQGSLLSISSGITLIIDSADLTLEGLTDGQNGATQNNNIRMIAVSGKLELRNGTICGNTSYNNNVSAGNAVLVNGSGASFIMSGGIICDHVYDKSLNPYSGGIITEHGTVAIHNGSSFTMTGGTIRGNTVSGYGGGVYVSDATFRITNGTIYGSNETDPSLKNNAGNGAALYLNGGTAQRGTFNGETWVSSGDLSTTNNTIRVVNGALQ